MATLTQVKGLEYTDEVAKSTAPIYQKLARQYREDYWKTLAPYIHEINRLKKEKNAVILAHNYMTPDIFYGVGDIVGDSLKLAQEAAKTQADIIVQCGVHFMAETSKVLCPDKKVLIPDMKAGCSLAESITAADVRALKAQHPGIPVVTYVNTSAEVKAESDVCCTSSNALKIVNALGKEGHSTVIMTPDKFLAQNVAAQTDVKIIIWDGACIVHERFTAQDVKRVRAQHAGAIVLAHPECPPEVIAESDYTGSTAQMDDYIKKNQPKKAVLMTECSMSDNIASANPEVEMIGACQMCPYMKRISLPKILACLQNESPEVTVPAEIIPRARRAVERMLELS
ncbi:MAG TPA: quinolinate synthase NadA [Alphaproteobacteria bacterium]|nr:quinolinate synthase NadA [Micavibrio sp.]HQX28058.1 quinolinate synthase NadA [Alphaproteobacteria bacterium]